MRAIPAYPSENTPARTTGGAAGSWQRRLENPLRRYYREPVARWIARGLAQTRLGADLLTGAGLSFAAAAAVLLTYSEPTYIVGAALAFELRSLLGCAGAALARERGLDPAGPSVRAAAWLGAAMLYAGIVCHLHLYPPPAGPWSEYLSTNSVLALAAAQAVVRALAAGHYRLKYRSIFEEGRDAPVESLRAKAQALGPSSTLADHLEVLVGRAEHLAFEHERFDADRGASSVDADRVKQLQREETSWLTRLITGLWAISDGEVFLSLVVLTLLLDELWLGQVFFATVGVVWIVAVVCLNGWFLRGATRRAKPAVA